MPSRSSQPSQRPSGAKHLAFRATPERAVGAIESPEERAARLLRNRLVEATADVARIDEAVDAAIDLLVTAESAGASREIAQRRLLAVVADVQSRIWSSVPDGDPRATNADDAVRSVVAAAISPP